MHDGAASLLFLSRFHLVNVAVLRSLRNVPREGLAGSPVRAARKRRVSLRGRVRVSLLAADPSENSTKHRVPPPPLSLALHLSLLAISLRVASRRALPRRVRNEKERRSSRTETREGEEMSERRVNRSEKNRIAISFALSKLTRQQRVLPVSGCRASRTIPSGSTRSRASYFSFFFRRASEPYPSHPPLSLYFISLPCYSGAHTFRPMIYGTDLIRRCPRAE